jgi:hypothetical protein
MIVIQAYCIAHRQPWTLCCEPSCGLDITSPRWASFLGWTRRLIRDFTPILAWVNRLLSDGEQTDPAL